MPENHVFVANEYLVYPDRIRHSMKSRKHAQTRPSPVPVALLLIDVNTVSVCWRHTSSGCLTNMRLGLKPTYKQWTKSVSGRSRIQHYAA